MRTTLFENPRLGQAAKDTAPPILFDRSRIAMSVARAWTGTPDFVTALAVSDLHDRLSPIKRAFGRAAILGPDPRALPQRTASADGPIALERVSTLVPGAGAPVCDPEALSLPHDGYDLIVSLLDIQTVNDVPGFLSRLRAHLAPDGLLVAAAIGGRTLTELRAAWARADTERFGTAVARIAPFMDVRDAGGLLQRAGFALPVTDVETHRVRYSDPLALIKEIKALGAANPMAKTPPAPVTKGLLAEAMVAYPADPDGRIGATLEIVWMSGWRPHESQQKPLNPGSAEISLSKVLGDKS